jgi:hypothetical protein
LWDLRLKGFFSGNRDLLVTLQVNEGALGAAAAMAPAWNRAIHTVSAKDLKLADGGLTGTMNLTLCPDSAIPADKKAVSCAVKLRASCDGQGRLNGEYSGGQADGKSVEGRVTPCAPPAAPKPPGSAPAGTQPASKR